MQIIWTNKSILEFSKIAEYIKYEFGYKAKEKFKKSVKRTEKIIKDNPYIKPQEELLLDDPRELRSILVNKLNKLIYFVDKENNTIYIADIWDIRQCPENLKNRV